MGREKRLIQQDRPPIVEYEQAVWRIVQRRYEGISEEAVEELYKLTADIFWKTDKQVARDVLIAYRSIGGR